MYTKAQIYNLALGALLLQRRITNTETDTSNEVKVLNTHWASAWAAALEDMDLDGTSTQAVLALAVDYPNDQWRYGYTYPANCAFLRRIQSGAVKDDSDTFIDKLVRIRSGAKLIFTNQVDAVAEYISTDVLPEHLSAAAGLAVAYRLAEMSAPLIVGKGAAKLRDEIEKKYIRTKAEAQEQDRKENFSFDDPTIESEFVRERTS